MPNTIAIVLLLLVSKTYSAHMRNGVTADRSEKAHQYLDLMEGTSSSSGTGATGNGAPDQTKTQDQTGTGSATGSATGTAPVVVEPAVTAPTTMITQRFVLSGLTKQTAAEANKKLLSVGIAASFGTDATNIEITSIEEVPSMAVEEGTLPAVTAVAGTAPPATDLRITIEVAVDEDDKAQVQGKMEGSDTTSITSSINRALKDQGDAKVQVAVLSMEAPTVETKSTTAAVPEEKIHAMLNVVREQIRVVTNTVVQDLDNVTKAALALSTKPIVAGESLGVMSITNEKLFDHDAAMALNVARKGAMDSVGVDTEENKEEEENSEIAKENNKEKENTKPTAPEGAATGDAEDSATGSATGGATAGSR